MDAETEAKIEQDSNEQTRKMVFEGIVNSREGDNFKRSFGDYVYIYLNDQKKFQNAEGKEKMEKQADYLKKYMNKVKMLLAKNPKLNYEDSLGYVATGNINLQPTLPYRDD